MLGKLPRQPDCAEVAMPGLAATAPPLRHTTAATPLTVTHLKPSATSRINYVLYTESTPPPPLPALLQQPRPRAEINFGLSGFYS